MERGNATLFRMHWDIKMSVLILVIVFKNGEKYVLGLIDTTMPQWIGLQRSNRIGYPFSLSKDDVLPSRIVIKIRRLEPKQPRFSILLLHVSCNTNTNTLKKQRTNENKEAAVDYAKLLSK